MMQTAHALPRIIDGLSQIAPQFDSILCDVWGVIHNGHAQYAPAVDALRSFRARHGGPVILVTNAPRPADQVAARLAQLNITPDAYDAIVTSGDLTRRLIAREGSACAFFLGPERDHDIVNGLPCRLGGLEEARFIICTGLFDDTREMPDDYTDMLTGAARRGLPLICANPDLVVDRGGTLVWCAGALARLYREAGGTVRIAGKPHRPIYEAALERITAMTGHPYRKSRILAIGDGPQTDIAGAANAGITALFITDGIHGADFAGPALEARIVGKFLARFDLAALAAMRTLRW